MKKWYIFFCKEGYIYIQIKKIVIENQLKKSVFYAIVWKTKLSEVGIVRLDSGREPNLSGSESNMYTVHARSKICPCVPPHTRLLVCMFYNLLWIFGVNKTLISWGVKTCRKVLNPNHPACHRKPDFSGFILQILCFFPLFPDTFNIKIMISHNFPIN